MSTTLNYGDNLTDQADWRLMKKLRSSIDFYKSQAEGDRFQSALKTEQELWKFYKDLVVVR